MTDPFGGTEAGCDLYVTRFVVYSMGLSGEAVTASVHYTRRQKGYSVIKAGSMGPIPAYSVFYNVHRSDFERYSDLDGGKADVCTRFANIW